MNVRPDLIYQAVDRDANSLAACPPPINFIGRLAGVCLGRKHRAYWFAVTNIGNVLCIAATYVNSPDYWIHSVLLFTMGLPYRMS